MTRPAPRHAGRRRRLAWPREEVGRHRVEVRQRLTAAALVEGHPRLTVALGLLVATVGIGALSVASGTAYAARDGSSSAVAEGHSNFRQAMLVERELRISRDSSRQALGDSSGGEVETPGNAQGVEKNAEIRRLASSVQKAVNKILKNAWGLPIPKGVYHLTARFGECSGLWSHCHTGLDFAAPEGTPIRAVANGTIIETGWAGAYGNRTAERLEDGTVLWYCHQSAIQVQPGDVVAGGQVIGLVGATGNTTGPHLHLEVRPGGGDPVDPYQALKVRGVTP